MGQGRTLLIALVCGKKDVPTGGNLNQYVGPGSLFVAIAI